MTARRRKTRSRTPQSQAHVKGNEKVEPISNVVSPLPKLPLEREVYLKERDSLIQSAEAAGEEHSKQVLTIACGAFGVSLLLIEKLVPEGCTTPVWLVLVSSWISFGVSIYCTMSSYLMSFDATDEQIRALDAQQTGQKAENGNSRESVTRLTKVSSRALCLGVLLLGIFASLNRPAPKGNIGQEPIPVPPINRKAENGVNMSDKEPRYDKVEGRYMRPGGPVAPDVKIQPPVTPAPTSLPVKDAPKKS